MLINYYIQIVLFFAYTLFTISLGLSFFDDKSSPSIWTCYTSILALLSFTILAYKTTRLKLKDFKYKNLSSVLLISFVCLLAGSLNAYNQYSKRDIWIDEISQFERASLQAHESDITINAAVEQQPPLHYYLNYLSFKTFDNTKIAPRFFSIVFYLLFCFVTPIFAFLITGSILNSALSSLLVLASYHLTFYSIEGRPFILAAFFGFIYLISIFNRIELLSRNEKVSPLLDTSSRINTIASAVLLALTISIQPALLMLVVVLPQIFSSTKKNFIKIFSEHALVAFLLSPIFFIIYKKSVEMNQFREQISVSSLIANLKTNTVELWYFLISTNITYLFLIMIIFILFTKSKDRLRYTAQIVLPNILLPTSILVFMTIFINWGVYHRYYIIMSSLTLVSIIYLLREFKVNNPTNKFIYIFLLLLTFDLGQTIDSKYSKFQELIPTEKIYRFLSKNAKKDDLALFLNFTLLGQWRGDYWVAQNIYYTEEKRTAKLLKKSLGNDSIPYISKSDLNRSQEPTSIYLLQRLNWNKVQLTNLYKKLNLEYLGSFNKDYFIFKKTIRSINEWKIFLRDIIKNVDREFRFAPLEALIFYSISEKNEQEFQLLMKEYVTTKAHPKEGSNYEKSEYILNMENEKAKRIKLLNEAWINGY